MGLGPVKNGKQQVITPWVGSWAWGEATGQPNSALAARHKADAAARGIRLDSVSFSMHGPFMPRKELDALIRKEA